MKKILLLMLCSAAIAIFSSCNNDSNNNGETPPVDTTAKPKLGYFDFKHWHDIMLKDMESVKPLLRGTYLRDTITLKKKSLVYAQETDCGKFTIAYMFNSKNILVHIYANLVSEEDMSVVKTPADVFKYSKIISDEMNTYVKSITDRGKFASCTFEMYKKNDFLKGLPDDNTKYNQEKYSWLWDFTDRVNNKGVADDESFRCTEMWQIKDDVQFPDGQTPEIMPVIMYASFAVDESYTAFSGWYIDVQFKRFGVFKDNDITNPDI